METCFSSNLNDLANLALPTSSFPSSQVLNNTTIASASSTDHLSNLTNIFNKFNTQIYYQGLVRISTRQYPDGSPASAPGWDLSYIELVGAHLHIYPALSIPTNPNWIKFVSQYITELKAASVTKHTTIHVSETHLIPKLDTFTKSSISHNNKECIIQLNSHNCNLIWFELPSTNAVNHFYSMFQVVTFEFAKLNEYFTHYLLNHIQTLKSLHIPQDPVFANWVQIKFPGSVEDWIKVWCVVQSSHAHQPSSSSFSSLLFKKKSLSTSSSSLISSTPEEPVFNFYKYKVSNPSSRKKPMLRISNLFQCFAIYPECPHLIDTYTQCKVHGSVHVLSPSLGALTNKPNQVLILTETSSNLGMLLITLMTHFKLYNASLPQGRYAGPLIDTATNMQVKLPPLNPITKTFDLFINPSTMFDLDLDLLPIQVFRILNAATANRKLSESRSTSSQNSSDSDTTDTEDTDNSNESGLIDQSATTLKPISSPISPSKRSLKSDILGQPNTESPRSPKCTERGSRLAASSPKEKLSTSPMSVPKYMDAIASEVSTLSIFDSGPSKPDSKKDRIGTMAEHSPTNKLSPTSRAHTVAEDLLNTKLSLSSPTKSSLIGQPTTPTKANSPTSSRTNSPTSSKTNSPTSSKTKSPTKRAAKKETLPEQSKNTKSSLTLLNFDSSASENDQDETDSSSGESSVSGNAVGLSVSSSGLGGSNEALSESSSINGSSVSLSESSSGSGTDGELTRSATPKSHILSTVERQVSPTKTQSSPVAKSKSAGRSESSLNSGSESDEYTGKSSISSDSDLTSSGSYSTSNSNTADNSDEDQGEIKPNHPRQSGYSISDLPAQLQFDPKSVDFMTGLPQQNVPLSMSHATQSMLSNPYAMATNKPDTGVSLVPQFVQFGGLLSKPKPSLLAQHQEVQKRQQFYAQLQNQQQSKQLQEHVRQQEQYAFRPRGPLLNVQSPHGHERVSGSSSGLLSVVSAREQSRVQQKNRFTVMAQQHNSGVAELVERGAGTGKPLAMDFERDRDRLKVMEQRQLAKELAEERERLEEVRAVQIEHQRIQYQQQHQHDQNELVRRQQQLEQRELVRRQQQMDQQEGIRRQQIQQQQMFNASRTTTMYGQQPMMMPGVVPPPQFMHPSPTPGKHMDISSGSESGSYDDSSSGRASISGSQSGSQSSGSYMEESEDSSGEISSSEGSLSNVPTDQQKSTNRVVPKPAARASTKTKPRSSVSSEGEEEMPRQSRKRYNKDRNKKRTKTPRDSTKMPVQVPGYGVPGYYASSTPMNGPNMPMWPPPAMHPAQAVAYAMQMQQMYGMMPGPWNMMSGPPNTDMYQALTTPRHAKKKKQSMSRKAIKQSNIVAPAEEPKSSSSSKKHVRDSKAHRSARS